MTYEPQVSVDVIRGDIRATWNHLGKQPVPAGFVTGAALTGLVPRVQIRALENAAPTLAEMLNLRIVDFRYHLAVRNGRPIWWITGSLEGVEDVVVGPSRLE